MGESARRRILVVDDNTAIHEDFRKILGGEADTGALSDLRAALLSQGVTPQRWLQYDIDSAYQGQEALEKVCRALAEGKPYMLAFVDMRMPPGWDGLETIEHLWEKDRDIQVVICTAYSDHSWEDMLERLGLVDNLLILKKPFDNVEVSQLACALTEKWCLAQQVRLQLDNLEETVEKRTTELRRTNERLQEEIAQREKVEDRLRHDAFHDRLTGLPNRALLLDRLRCCVKRAQRDPDYTFAVLFWDIDNFKFINDSLGHRVGDELLQEVAKRLVNGLRSLDTVVHVREDIAARLGGDEFVVLLNGIRKPNNAVLVAERIRAQLSVPFTLSTREVVISASVGIALYDSDSGDAEELLRNADTAMFRAKQAGKARYAIFNENMHTEVVRRLELENDLRAAMDRQQFHIFYQAIVELGTGRITSFEALLRWKHPDRGLILPDSFIPIAEEIGLIVPLGRWVLQKACKQLRIWNNRLAPAQAISVSVNVSKKQLLEPEFVADVERVLRDTGIEGRNLSLEVTESAIIEASKPVAEGLKQLKQLGVQLHMDDFGTGYSSLSCLHRFPLDVLKVDREFVKTLEARRQYTAIIHAIISLAHNLGMKVTAEGVETEEQLVQILTLDCDYAQGYYFSTPVDVLTATTLITSEPAWLTRV